MILHLENPKESIHEKQKLDLINESSKVSEYKINIQNQLYCYALDEHSKKQIEKTIML